MALYNHLYAEGTAPSPLRGTPPNLGGELRLLSSTGLPLIGALLMLPYSGGVSTVSLLPILEIFDINRLERQMSNHSAK